MIYSLESDDREEFEHYYRGPEYHSLIINIINEFRSKVKYEMDTGSWIEANDVVNRLLNESNIEL